MANKYKLKTNNMLKCAACGNNEFEEHHKEKEGKEKWIYVCSKCGLMMKFVNQLEVES